MLTKAEFVKKYAEMAGVSQKAAEKSVDDFMNTLEAVICNGDGVRFVGKFSVSVEKRAARNGRNPQTGETVKIPASKVVKFKVGQQFKDCAKHSKKKK